MTTARAATLAAALKQIVAAPDETVRVEDVLAQHRLFTQMVTAARGEIGRAHV